MRREKGVGLGVMRCRDGTSTWSRFSHARVQIRRHAVNLFNEEVITKAICLLIEVHRHIVQLPATTKKYSKPANYKSDTLHHAPSQSIKNSRGQHFPTGKFVSVHRLLHIVRQRRD